MQDEAQEQLDAVYEALDVDVMPDTLQLRIAETIVRLPEEIASFAIHNIHWRLFEPTWRGVTYLLPERPPPMVSTYEEWLNLLEQRQRAPAMERHWLVVLNHDLGADDADQEAARRTIAHETAHAVLGHSCCRGAMAPHLEFEETERAADRLATDWGFACWPSWVDAEQAGAQ